MYSRKQTILKLNNENVKIFKIENNVKTSKEKRIKLWKELNSMESQLEVLTNFLPVLIDNEQIQHSVYLLLQMLNSGREIHNNLEIYFFTNFEHHKVENYAEEWLDKYLDYDFFQLFRFQKQTVSNLLSRVDGPDMNVPFSGGGLPICAYKQLLITLWWLGKGETLISVADKFNVAISTVYSIAERVLDKLINLKEHYIKWPDHLEIITVEDNFRKIGGYPGVVGAIDCCNIEFKAPKTQQDSYIDKNSRHSIKLQGIVTSNKIYTNINVGFPGSAHDSRVFKNSNLYVDITINNNLQTYFKSDEYHLVGDKAYPLIIWLMSPFKTKCYLSLGAQDAEGKIAGAIILHTYPNIPAVPQWEWDHWIYNIYGLTEANNTNTLWIHLLLWDPAFYFLFLRPLMQHLFNIKNRLEFCIMVIPPGLHRTDFFCDLGNAVLSKDYSKHKTCQYLYVFCRKDFMVKYKIRRAVEEDNDDLVPLIHSHSKRLKECYGSYYIAEILTRHKDMGRQIIVAEYQGTAVSVLCLNETVNFKALNEEFELTPYNGLKKPHPDDFIDLSLEDIRQSLEQLHSKVEDEILDIIDQRSGQLGSRRSSEDELLVHISISESDQFSLVFTSASMFLFQDDEDKDTGPMSLESDDDSQALLSQYLDIHDKDPRVIEMDWVSGYSCSKGKIHKIPEFNGESNAFALEIAATLPEHEYGLLMLFEAAFECFPERDYCIMAIPATTPVNKLSMYFSRIIPRPSGSYPYELYAMHKKAILGTMKVEVASKEHEKQVKYLISTIPNYPIVLHHFEICVKHVRSSYNAFVISCEDQVVGVATVSEEFSVEYLHAHYDLQCIDNKIHRAGSHGVIESIILSPIFQRYAQFFLSEIHRLSDFSVLYYRHTPYDTTEAYRERPLLNILQNLLPIMPRKQPEYDLKILRADECAPSEIVTEKQDPFALYLSTMSLCSVSRHSINTRIVVVGCSHTSLAFLESLIFQQSPHYLVTFNNVTLHCPTGLAYTKVANRIRDSFMVKKNFMDARYMDMLSFKTYVNIAQGKITKIDRKEQMIVINANSFISYDLLFLMSGEQFQMPMKPNRSPFQEKPENVFVLNNSIDANNAVLKLKHLHTKYKDPDYVIIIYGHFLQAHCAISGLITYGVPGSHMVLVEPFPYSMAIEKRHRHNVSIYNDPEIDQTVYDSIRAEGVEIYSSFYFIDWTYDPVDNIITMAKFESRHNMLEMECMALFFFNEKEISPRIYRVINTAGLVYDGRLVIDNKCQTNDPNIFGAGTLTKYSRKYYAPNMIHKYYNRVEIGQRLGYQIREMIVDSCKKNVWEKKKAGWNFHIERGKSLVQRYVQPIMRYCRLPGGLYYFSVIKPGRRIPLETAISMENYGQVLITGNCRDVSKQGYFQLHFNEFNRVETITCLTQVPIDIYNLHCLWGKHERLLNNITLRFEMVLITDLFEFFKEPWAYALYHDKFNYLLDELNMLMTSTVGIGGQSLINDLITLYKQHKWQVLSEDAKDSIEEKFTTYAYPKIIEQKVLDFIKINLDFLPMYAHPVVVRALLRNFENSPLFS